MSATSGWYAVCFDAYTAPDGFYVQLRSNTPVPDSCGNLWFPSIIWGTNVVGGRLVEFGPYGDGSSTPALKQGGARFLYFKPENYDIFLWGKGPAGSAYELGITQVFGVSGTAGLDLGIDQSTGYPELTAPPTDAQLVEFLQAYSRWTKYSGETDAEINARAPGRINAKGGRADVTWVGGSGQTDRTPEAQSFIPGVTGDARFSGTRSVLEGAPWNTWPAEMNAFDRVACPGGP